MTTHYAGHVLGRRATIEQAKEILIARHAIDPDDAFEMLRNHPQQNGHKLFDIAPTDPRQPPPS